MFFNSEGTKLFYAVHGSGPEVILLHPTPVDHSFWMPVATSLSQHYRVILPDLRGHGQSEAGEQAFSMELFSRDIERLMNHLEIKRAAFIGCSIGGYTLYEIWRSMPERANCLAFCCGKPQSDTLPARQKRMETIDAIRRNGVSDFFDKTILNLVGSAFRLREPGKVAELRNMMEAMAPESVIRIQQCLMERPDSVPTLPEISVPVMALAAGKDQASTPEEMKVIPNALPSAEYHLLPDAGHYAPFEESLFVSRILLEFLDRLTAGARE